MRPTLSIWVRCHREARLVRRLVDLVRPYADEVIIAFELGMPDDDVSILAAGPADRLVAIPHVEPSERANAWLHAQCSGDWTLRLDYDEVPSSPLLHALPELIAAPDVVAYYVPRLWNWPHPGRVMVQRPWWPDHQPRLLRADPELVRFSATIHTQDEPVGPVGMVELPIYHLDLVLTSRAYRTAKAAAYAAQRAMPDILEKPFNEAYYLPETYDAVLPVVPVPTEDEVAIAHVMNGPEPPSALHTTDPVTARLAELDAAYLGMWRRNRDGCRTVGALAPASQPEDRQQERGEEDLDADDDQRRSQDR